MGLSFRAKWNDSLANDSQVVEPVFTTPCERNQRGCKISAYILRGLKATEDDIADFGTPTLLAKIATRMGTRRY
jgi:hypothetical protein